MAKLTNIKERVQQPQRDALIRTAGLTVGTLTGRDSLFQSNNNAKGIGDTNLRSGNVLPSDQSMIILALRVFAIFRNPILRGTGTPIASNGDISAFPNLAGQAGADNAQGQTSDVWRLYCQTTEQLFWTFGAGEKPSITSMPTAYFPYGGGLVSDLAGSSNLIHGSVGLQTHGSMLKLARAIMLVPRQQIQCLAESAPYANGGQQATFGTVQGARNMLSVTDNLNAVDAVQKVVTFTFDGLLSRDVQLAARARHLRRAPRLPRAPLAHPGGRGSSLLASTPLRNVVTAKDTVSRAPTEKVPTMTQGPHPFQLALQQMSNKIGALENTIGRMAQEHQRLNQVATEAKILAQALQNVKVEGRHLGGGDFKANKAWAKAWGGSDYVSLDSIQGRFVPFDLFTEILVPDNTAATVEGVLKVSMEGPFVATHRYAAFLSDVRYQVNFANGSSATFKGRTNGRFRGISSNTDLVDAIRAFEQINQYQPSHVGAVLDGGGAVVAVGNPVGVNENSTGTSTTNILPNFPGSGRPLVVSPLSMSGGRSMQFDGTIAVQPQGAQFNRQNIPVPSSMWDGNNKMSKLSCYDVLEPGEEVIVKVSPTHVNNPPFGNISDLIALNYAGWAFAATGIAANNPMPVGSWPFLAGQFDGHEGINDQSFDGDTSVTVDRVIRSFDARLIIGFKGFRIIAPPGRG